MIANANCQPVLRSLSAAELSLVAGGYSSEIVVTGDTSNWWDDWGWSYWSNYGYDDNYDQYGYGDGNGGGGGGEGEWVDTDGDGVLDSPEIVVVGQQPTPVMLAGAENLYGQFYDDGVVVLSHWVPDSWLQDVFNYGGHYEVMGTFTYTVDVNGPTANWENEAQLSHDPAINDTITATYGGTTYHFTPTQEP